MEKKVYLETPKFTGRNVPIPPTDQSVGSLGTTFIGHAGAMNLTERVYTHLDTQVLVDAINKIYIPENYRKNRIHT